MKKIILLLLLIICKSGLSLFGQTSVAVPEEGTFYTIQQSTAASGLYITRALNKDNPLVTLLSGDADQVFAFEPVAGADGAYYIRNMLTEEYLVLQGGDKWTMVWVTDPTAIATLANGEYQILPLTGTTDYVQIKNLGSNLVGTNSNPTDSATVYADKSGTTDPAFQWKIRVYTNEVDKSALQSKVDEAQAFLDASVQGNLPDQYPTTTYNTLEEQLSYAEDLLDNPAATQPKVNAQLQALTQALQDYKDSVNPLLPDPSATFYIIHSSGLYLQDGPVIASADYSPNQQFRFVPVAGQTAVYNIKVLSETDNMYITRSADNGWGLSMANDPTATAAQFQIKSVGGGYYRINCMLTSSGTGYDNRTNYTMGTDYPDNATSFGVFIDKTGTDVKDHWIIENINVQGVVKTALQAAVDKVNDFLKYTGSGNGSDQIPADEYSALMTALDAAETALANSDVQSDINDATTALNSAFAAAIAVINPFQPDTALEYNIINSSGLYFGEYSDDTVVDGIGIFTQTNTDDQKFQFVAVPDSTGVYNIKNVALGQYLTRSVAPHLDGSGQQQIDGSGNAMYDDYALVWGDDPTTALAQFVMKKTGVQNYYTIKCDTVGPYRNNSYVGVDNGSVSFSGVFVDKDGTNVLHYWSIVDASTNNSIKPVVVNTAIAYGADRLLTISSLIGSSRILIYTTTGQLIANSVVNESEYTKTLPAGSYIVIVKGNSSYRGVIIVR